MENNRTCGHNFFLRIQTCEDAAQTGFPHCAHTWPWLPRLRLVTCCSKEQQTFWEMAGIS